jgi:tetratricopeptide (TPR) repeat protein
MDTAQFEKHRVSDHHQTSAQAQEQSRSAKGLAHAESAGLARPSDQAAEAFAEFDSELPPVPSEPMAIAKLMSHAHVLIKAREHSLALHILRNVLLRSPQHFDATMAMAQCFRELGQFEQALKCYRSLTKTAETIELKTRAKFFMAETYYLMERDPMALACYRDALKSMTADQEALFTAYKNIGNIYVRAGDFEGGEEFYNKAYTIQPQ